MLHSIQITSNSPVLPWELVRPAGAGRHARRLPRHQLSPGALGAAQRRPARSTGRSTGWPSPASRPSRPPMTAISSCRSRRSRSMRCRKLAGFRLVAGDFGSFEKMLGEVSTGFIHFSGHGEVNDPGTGSPVFAIRLLDQALDPTTWRALTFAPHDKGNPFFFFNACDTGRARSLGGFVQGWGPAVLASGASGFIGGMWPLTDQHRGGFLDRLLWRHRRPSEGRPGLSRRGPAGRAQGSSTRPATRPIWPTLSTATPICRIGQASSRPHAAVCGRLPDCTRPKSRTSARAPHGRRSAP